jgi:hypothetical protein
MWLRGRGCGHRGPSFELRSIFQQFFLSDHFD